MAPKKKSLMFVLYNINPLHIEQTLRISLVSNITTPRTSTVAHTPIAPSRIKEYTTYERRGGQLQELVVSTIHTSTHCYWDRHPFSTLPVHIPIRYYPNTIQQVFIPKRIEEYFAIRTYLSRMDEDQHVIPTHKIDLYESDGVYCSFNCAFAAIQDQSTQSKYLHSYPLLVQCWKDLQNDERPVNSIPTPAPSWRLLQSYGGPLTIDEFRSTHCLAQYSSSQGSLVLALNRHYLVKRAAAAKLD